MPEKQPSKRKQVIQGHHITYEPEWVVPVTKGEHYVVTQLQRFKSLSDGAKQAILYLLATTPRREMPDTSPPN